MSAKLFVGNLSFNITENDLQDAFAAHGTVIEANLMMDRATGRPRGFGFVTMSSPEEAQKAIDALNGKELGGRALTVNIARPREERTGGGGGGGGGGRGGYGGWRRRSRSLLVGRFAFVRGPGPPGLVLLSGRVPFGRSGGCCLCLQIRPRL